MGNLRCENLSTVEPPSNASIPVKNSSIRDSSPPSPFLPFYPHYILDLKDPHHEENCPS